MHALSVIFWLSLFIIIYSYAGYALVLFFLVTYKKIFFGNDILLITSVQPKVALIIPAYNEEDFILLKIQNTLELNYPQQKLSVIFITDGSTDNSPEIISRYPNFKLMHQPERKGKLAAMNRAMKTVKEPVVIFCDANTLLNRECIREIVKHYADPKVGGVAGEKKISTSDGLNAATAGEGLYWKYESFLKKMDAELYSVVGAAGELLSLRANLYETLPENTIIEDFVLSLRVCLKGYIIRYEPKAFAVETSSVTMKAEQERKVRISAGAFQAMGLLKPLFNIFKYPVLSFQFISHRILRWTLCPLCLVLMFISNLLLVIYLGAPVYIYLFSIQVIFYILAIVGWVFSIRNVKSRLLYVPYYFLFMNISVFMGMYRILTKGQSVLWEKGSRKKFA